MIADMYILFNEDTGQFMLKTANFNHTLDSANAAKLAACILKCLNSTGKGTHKIVEMRIEK